MRLVSLLSSLLSGNLDSVFGACTVFNLPMRIPGACAHMFHINSGGGIFVVGLTLLHCCCCLVYQVSILGSLPMALFLTFSFLFDGGHGGACSCRSRGNPDTNCFRSFPGSSVAFTKIKLFWINNSSEKRLIHCFISGLQNIAAVTVNIFVVSVVILSDRTIRQHERPCTDFYCALTKQP